MLLDISFAKNRVRRIMFHLCGSRMRVDSLCFAIRPAQGKSSLKVKRHLARTLAILVVYSILVERKHRARENILGGGRIPKRAKAMFRFFVRTFFSGK